jgi:hypothetical protein
MHDMLAVSSKTSKTSFMATPFPSGASDSHGSQQNATTETKSAMAGTFVALHTELSPLNAALIQFPPRSETLYDKPYSVRPAMYSDTAAAETVLIMRQPLRKPEMGVRRSRGSFAMAIMVALLDLGFERLTSGCVRCGSSHRTVRAMPRLQRKYSTKMTQCTTREGLATDCGLADSNAATTEDSMPM